jgi:phage baseplate assembly protein W
MSEHDFLGPGWTFPVVVEPDTGAIRLNTGAGGNRRDIEQALRILLGTPRGSRVMRPDFGCGIHELVFASMDASTLGEVEQNVRESIVRYEPRVELQRVSVRPAPDDPRGKLDIEVDYRIRSTNTPANLTYPFFLRERAT